LEGRVDIDGKTVTKLGVRVDVETQKVRVDGENLRIKRSTYFAVNKPTGIVSTNRDQAGRMRVVDLVPNGDQMFTVGRLDMHSSGLIIVTNDGDLANRLAHPRYEVEKTYRVTVAGHPGPAELQKLRTGIHLAEGPVKVSSVHIKSRQKQNTILHIVLREGRNREIRRMAARIGHKVLKLERIAIGPLRLGEMPAGAYRELTVDELRAVQRCVAGAGTKRRRPVRRRTTAKQKSAVKQRSNAKHSPSGPPKKRRTRTQR
jgi:23S rRNA pseudouridine2605 synthase